MLDVSTCAATDGKTPSNGGIDGSQNPIESYRGSKRGENDMEVDVDEGKRRQSHPTQAALNHNSAKNKPSRKKVTAVASPQKRRSTYRESRNIAEAPKSDYPSTLQPSLQGS